jgi:hypothetical protein
MNSTLKTDKELEADRLYDRLGEEGVRSPHVIWQPEKYEMSDREYVDQASGWTVVVPVPAATRSRAGRGLDGRRPERRRAGSERGYIPCGGRGHLHARHY